jgi:hypothetical protein
VYIRPPLQSIAIFTAGEAAEALLRQVAPGNGASSLADVFASSPAVEAGHDTIALLGRQQQWVAGAPVSCYLLLRTRPACLLTAPQVGSRLTLL